MFLDIKQMQLGKVRFSETIPTGAMEFLDQQIRQAAPIETAGSAEVMEAVLEIRVRGHLRTCMEAACDRCLEPASFRLTQISTWSTVRLPWHRRGKRWRWGARRPRSASTMETAWN